MKNCRFQNAQEEYFKNTFSVHVRPSTMRGDVYIYVKLCNTMRPRMPLGAVTEHIGHNESGEEDGVLQAPPLEMQQIFTQFFCRCGVARALGTGDARDS